MLFRLIIVLSAFTSFLLSAESEQSKWFYRAWQTEDGLPDNSVSTISQSPDGYLWIGTNGGAIRFNGNKFHPLPLGENANLPSQQVHAMLIDRVGRLWLGMERGPLVRIEKNSSRLFQASNGLPDKRIGTICEDLGGRIWANYSGGVVRIDGDEITRFSEKHRIPTAQHSSVVCDTDGQVWMASHSWLGRLDDEGYHRFQRFDSAPLRIAPSRQSGLWIINESTLLLLESDFKRTHVVDLPAGLTVNTIFEDHLGAVWIGTQKNGLLRFFEKHLERIPTSHPWISCIQEDQNHNIWIGTKGGGLNLILTRTASLIDQAFGLPFSSVRSISCDSRGRTWATSLDGQIGFRSSGKWHLFTDLPEGTIAQCLSTDTSGLVWIGTKKNGIYQLKDNELTSFEGLSTGFVRSILSTKNDDLLVTTSYPHHLHRIRNGEIFTFEKPIDFISIRAITESPDGTLWIGSSNGHLLRIDGDHLIDESAIDGPQNLSIRTLHSTPDGSLWIGYAGYGLGHLKSGVYRRFTKEHGLHDNYISQIQHDDHDRLWILANRGLFKVGLENLLAESSHLYCQFFGRNHALPSIQPSRDFSPSSTRNHNGQLYFSTHQGLLKVIPDHQKNTSLPPQVLLEKITLNSKLIALFKNRSILSDSPHIVDLSRPNPRLTLPPDHDNLVISFAALNFTSPENTLIRYRLLPWDKTWQVIDHQSNVTFPRLPAGNYQFEVIASNSNGLWSKDGPSLELIVKPFYWETWWFKLAIGVTTALTAGGFVFLGLKRKHRDQLRKLTAREALEQERSRIARDIHDDLGASLTRIALLSQSPTTPGQTPPPSPMSEIRSTTRELMRSMDGVVWAISPEHDEFDDLANYLSSYAQEFLSVADISCRFLFPVDLPERKLSAQLRHNLLLAFKEALNNIVKYAEASEVRISLTPAPRSFTLEIKDNGQGIDPEAPADPLRPITGKGLANMQNRMEEIGGTCLVESNPGIGTTIEFKVPFKINP